MRTSLKPQNSNDSSTSFVSSEAPAVCAISWISVPAIRNTASGRLKSFPERVMKFPEVMASAWPVGSGQKQIKICGSCQTFENLTRSIHAYTTDASPGRRRFARGEFGGGAGGALLFYR